MGFAIIMNEKINLVLNIMNKIEEKPKKFNTSKLFEDKIFQKN